MTLPPNPFQNGWQTGGWQQGALSRDSRPMRAVPAPTAPIRSTVLGMPPADAHPRRKPAIRRRITLPNGLGGMHENALFQGFSQPETRRVRVRAKIWKGNRDCTKAYTFVQCIGSRAKYRLRNAGFFRLPDNTRPEGPGHPVPWLPGLEASLQ